MINGLHPPNIQRVMESDPRNPTWSPTWEKPQVSGVRSRRVERKDAKSVDVERQERRTLDDAREVTSEPWKMVKMGGNRQQSLRMLPWMGWMGLLNV